MIRASYYSYPSKLATGERSSSPTKPAIVTILANIKTLAKVKKRLKPNLQGKKHFGRLV